MPRYTISPETMAEYSAEYAEIEGAEEHEFNTDGTERTPDGGFSHYEPGETTFDPGNLNDEARRTYDALRSIGIHTLRVRYDGGHDEGFSHFEAAQSDDQLFSLQGLIEAAKIGPLGEDGTELHVWNEKDTEISRAQWGAKRALEFVRRIGVALTGARIWDGRIFALRTLHGRFTKRQNRGRTDASRRLARRLRRALPILMAHPFYHAQRSARLFGGVADDYLAIHSWFDESKAFMPDLRHRALRHHSEGIFLCEKIFGVTIANSDGKPVPTRSIGEQHVQDDLGWIPTLKDWLCHLEIQPWMTKTRFRPTASKSIEPESETP